MLRSVIDTSWIYRKLKRTGLYFFLKDPKGFLEYKKEMNFYTNLLNQHTGKNDLIFDVGANMGRKSFFFSKLSKEVIAFEPGERLFNYLKNRFDNSNVIVLNYALGSEQTKANYYLIEENQAYNSLSSKHIDTTARKRGIGEGGIETFQVKVNTLDYFIQEYGFPKYIKIDVEGFEEEVIKGLKDPVPILSFESNLPDFYEETIRILDRLNTISKANYFYNIAIDNTFIYEEFKSYMDLKQILSGNTLNYLEIFAVIKR